ncbi:MAG: ABC transporter permease [Gemmatimonadales bacterium]|jgi:putative ABC transport system permease protein
MSSLGRDLRIALRIQRRGRVAHLIAIFSLALGIAGNAVVFSIVSALLFRPLPYPEPDRIVVLGERETNQPDLAILTLTSSLATWADYREQSRTLSGWAAINPGYRSLSTGDGSVSVVTGAVTPSFFETLGANTVRGRLFAEAEGVPGGPKLALLSWEYWQARMGPDEDPIGTVLTVDGEPYEVIGVLAEGFEFIVRDIEVWLPLQRDPYTTPRHQRNVVSVARMVPGVTMAEVEAEVKVIAERIERLHPETRGDWTVDALNLRTEIPDPQSRLYVTILQTSVFLVLLIACANIAILLLAWSQDRRREIALRAALGAGPLRIFAQLTRESLVMAALGGTAGLALAAGGIRLIADRFVASVLPRMWLPSLDTSVVLFTVGITALCGLVFGLFPALQSIRTNLVEALKEGVGVGFSGGRRRGRVRTALVVAEIALSLVALSGASVLIRSFLELRNRDPGFEASTLLTVRFRLPHWKYADAAETVAVLDQIRERIAVLPGAESAALATALPQDLFPSTDTFRVEGQPVQETVPRAISVRVSPEYLETFEVPLLQGRFFEESDRADASRVAVINRTMARRRFPGGSPIGHRVSIRGEFREIIGVATDVRQALMAGENQEFEETIYIPLNQEPTGGAYLVVRAIGDPRALAEPIRREVARIDPDLTITTVETMEEYATKYVIGFDVFSAIFGAFGIFALLLASLGTYGVVSYSVSQRNHEIGVRLALGGRAGDVVALVAVHGVRLSIIGLLVGTLLMLPVVVLIGRLLEEMGLAPVEPVVVVAVAALLFGVTVAASIIPASRAAKVDPMRVLKAE